MTLVRAMSLSVCAFVLSTGSAQASSYAGMCRVSVSGRTVTCDAKLGDPMWVERTSSTGFTLGVDMSGFYAMTLYGTISSGSGWLLNVGDSETNNGYCGDGASTSNDSELWVTGTNVYLCDSDRGGSDYLWTWTGALSTGTSVPFAVGIADGEALFQTGATTYKYLASDTIFQVDGDEPDPERGGKNDTLIWIGVNRVIDGPGSRTGTGMKDFTVKFYTD